MKAVLKWGGIALAEVNAAMPWRYLRLLTDDEVAALRMYLQSVPAKPFGGR